jgi:hypothetical protein
MSIKEYTAKINDYEEYTVRVFENGTTRWLDSHGQPHRIGGPAVESSTETMGKFKAYCKHGCAHNLDGPAIVFDNGDEWYYINGREYSKEGFDKEVERIKNEEVIQPTHPFDGKKVEIDGAMYRLEKIS